MRKKLSVTIGIPAYNEEANIGRLLRNLVSQNLRKIKIKEILVFSDGSHDHTCLEASQVKSDKIKVFNSSVRLGKVKRIKQIISHSTAEIIVFLDADILPVNKSFIEHLCKPYLNDTKLGMTGGKEIGLPAITITEEALNIFNTAFNRIRASKNKGDNVYNARGAVYSARKSFVKQIHWEDNGYDDNFVYFYSKKLGWNFKYCPRATVWYRNPHSAIEQIKQGARFTANIMVLSQYFDPSMVRSAYSITPKMQTELFLYQIKKNPIAYLWMKVLSLACYSYRYILAHNKQKTWTIASTSKILQLQPTSL